MYTGSKHDDNICNSSNSTHNNSKRNGNNRDTTATRATEVYVR